MLGEWIRGEGYVTYWPKEDTHGRLIVTLSPSSFDIAWPIGRPRSLGFEIFNLGLSGMVRLYRWQLSWGFARPGSRYCYLADRQLEHVCWLLGGPV